MPTDTTSSTEATEKATAAAEGNFEAQVEENTASAQDNETGENLEASEASAGKGEKDEKEQEKPKKKSGLQKRFNKLTSKLSAAEREIELLREQLHRPASEKTPAETRKSDSEPKEQDFDTHVEYVRALARYEAKQVHQAEKAKAAEDEVKKSFQSRVQTHQERVEAFAKDHEDFHDLMDEVEVPLSMAVREVILDSENGPALMYELAKNQEELKRICALGVVAAARELGKIEARLQKSPEEKVEIKTTKAPPPINPVANKSAGIRKSVFDKDISFADYERLRRDQMRKRA